MVWLRSVVVWLLASGGTAAVVALAGSTLRGLGAALRDPAGSPVAELLVGASAVVALPTACWLWLVTTDVVASVLRPRPRTSAAGRRTGPVRAVVLAACGVAAVTGPATASPPSPGGPAVVLAEQEPVLPPPLQGLPLPDRPLGGRAVRTMPPEPGRASPDARASRVRVAPGDSLWAIAERELGARSSVAEITAYWRRIHAVNADAIGPDPDLVHPGQLLRLPSHR